MKESLTYSLIPNNNPALEEKRKNIPSIFFFCFDKENWLEMFVVYMICPRRTGRVSSRPPRETRASLIDGPPIFSRLTPNEARQRQFRSSKALLHFFVFLFFFFFLISRILRVTFTKWPCHLKSPCAHSRSLIIPSSSYFEFFFFFFNTDMMAQPRENGMPDSRRAEKRKRQTGARVSCNWASA